MALKVGPTNKVSVALFVNFQCFSKPLRRVTKTDYKELRTRGNVVLMGDYRVINTSIACIIFFIVAGTDYSERNLH